MKRTNKTFAAWTATAAIAFGICLLASIALLCCNTARAEVVDEAFATINDRLAARNVEADEAARWACLVDIAETRAQRPEPGPEWTDGFDGQYYGEYDESLNGNLEYLNHGVWAGSYDNPFMADGEAWLDGQEFDWYSQRVLPGGGLTELNGNGRHVDEATGFIMDGDGYIAVASPWGQDPIGTVVETPFGQGKVYDENRGDAYDIYTDF